jgi:low affinity Fe/Cu permease
MADTKPNLSLSDRFSCAAHWTALQCGRVYTFLLAIAVIIAWAACGPLFDYSDTWQIWINTGTTIVTFLMVFLIQNTQNRDTAAIELKLDTLIRATANASNQMMRIEELPENEIVQIKETISKPVRRTRRKKF